MTHVNNTTYIHLRNLKLTPVTVNSRKMKFSGMPFGKAEYHELPWIKHMQSSPFIPTKPYVNPTRLTDVLFGPYTNEDIFRPRSGEKITLMPGEAAMIFFNFLDENTTIPQNSTINHR